MSKAANLPKTKFGPGFLPAIALAYKLEYALLALFIAGLLYGQHAAFGVDLALTAFFITPARPGFHSHTFSFAQRQVAILGRVPLQHFT